MRKYGYLPQTGQVDLVVSFVTQKNDFPHCA